MFARFFTKMPMKEIKRAFSQMMIEEEKRIGILQYLPDQLNQYWPSNTVVGTNESTARHPRPR